jgi:hypothetical protein
MVFTAYIDDEKSWSRLPTACIWPVQDIYMMNIFGPETSPIACTWPLQPIYMMNKVGPENSPTA